ncbi:NADH-quinone oxidoreductase subunit G [Nitratiruptor sp. YY08-26]|uniref:NADH-quinone oxidoreductase subunit G n=1 Tax=unclassified Nitratiruptor TaxID=2624044 RepID=UPI001916A34E|nr:MULTISPECIES: NADH-quinone oxidoreductase subunit G [unclassified Nitratiruptor]BCD61490.1 NADH-quinone oxidoreductase subunit G [Nitratiruptor sp. YY08-13]BCD65424.1 NADH-quinone oxidoreductase subunit G [Nitratiruptor sp. YY08-26]
MSEKIKITIDGKECETVAGEYVLNVARANGIFIPAICYLTNCSPTLACRLCLVEADGKQVYACNAKAKDGMSIVTVTENIIKERRAIMEVYDVNHPLECGVCDQSGECELQNYTLEMGVDEQHYAIRDTYRPVKKWNFIHYDSSLCIVCERCVTVCKDMIGDAALKTVPRGGDALDKSWKEQMPKDAYAMWNKLQKSIIGAVAGEELDCTWCGECISVCPVGALVSEDYHYTTNSWELNKIPAACAHCSAACHLYYETKHTSIENPEPKIYRVTNEFHYQPLCGAGRFGFDFENRQVKKDEKAFNSALEAFKKADTIAFDSYVTNEEALILQKLKEKYGYKLLNEDALRFKRFLENYSSYSGKSLPSAQVKDVHESNFVISVGTALKSDNPRVRYAFNNAVKMNKGGGIYFHPIKDPIIEALGKTVVPVYHKPLKEEAVLYFILQEFAQREELPKYIAEYLDSLMTTKTKEVEETIKEKVVEVVEETIVDEKTGKEKKVQKKITKEVPKKVKKKIEYQVSKLYEMIDAPEDLMEKLKKVLAKKEKAALILGEDLYTHPRAENIAKLAGIIERFTDFQVMLIPPKTNSLGVALICDLDDEAGEYTIGYNIKGDFTLSALGDGDLDMPALNQQEGTFTNIDKRVVPINVALPYEGYVLNDIARALGVSDKEYTIEFTQELPQEKGYQEVAFDDLPNEFLNDGTEQRGYVLKIQKVNLSRKNAESIEELPEFNGTVIYRCEPVLQFSPFTNKAHQLQEHGKLYASETFLDEFDLKEGDKVNIQKDDITITVEVALDDKIGSGAYIGTFDKSIDIAPLFKGYRFTEVKLQKV